MKSSFKDFLHKIDFNISQKNGKTTLEYIDKNNTFIETIVKLDSTELFITNKENYIYHYKAYEKLNFDYDLMYSIKNHKINRVNIINELSKLKRENLINSEFDFIIKTPPASHYIKEAAKLKSGSKEPGRVVVEAENVTKSYGDKTILKDINFYFLTTNISIKTNFIRKFYKQKFRK